MSDEHENPADRAWRDAVSPLRQGMEPPPELENRIASALRGRGRRRGLALALAAMALIALGGAVGRGWPRAPAPASAPDQPRYLLLLFEGPSYDSLSSSHAARVTEYAEWARGLASRGQMADGAELSPIEQRLGPMPDGSDDRHVISGYFIVIARDAAEARAIAETCPHLRHGGGVSVRPLTTS
jgi:hypothetical protein